MLMLLSLAACSARPKPYPYVKEFVSPPKALSKRMPHVDVQQSPVSANILLKNRASTLIVIDPGHGGKDIGTHSLKPIKYKEKTLNLTTARALNEYLRKMGYQTLMTRSDDRFISLVKRAEFANAKQPKLFVSVHYNSAPNPDAEGVEIFFYDSEKAKERSIASKKLGESIMNQIVINTEAKSRGVKHGNLAVVRETNMPAILVEGGFLTNKEELKRILNTSYQKRIAWGIAQGIQDYLENEK